MQNLDKVAKSIFDDASLLQTAVVNPVWNKTTHLVTVLLYRARMH